MPLLRYDLLIIIKLIDPNTRKRFYCGISVVYYVGAGHGMVTVNLKPSDFVRN